MPQPWENDDCAAMRAHYAVYSIPEAAALWCGVPEDRVRKVVEEAIQVSSSGLGRSIWKHSAVPCLEPRSRAIAEAIESGELPHGRENGSPVDANEHVAYERRHFLGRDLRQWMEKAFPNEKPAFLFDDIERSSHTAISTDAYRALKADHDKLETRLEDVRVELSKLRREKESIESERDSRRSIVGSVNSGLENRIPPAGEGSKLKTSAYWEELTKMATKAVDEYPAWKATQHRVQKTGNLVDWLTTSVGADNREAEIVKKILSDFFSELR